MLLQWDLNFDEKVSFGARLQLDGGFVFNVVYFSALKKGKKVLILTTSAKKESLNVHLRVISSINEIKIALGF